MFTLNQIIQSQLSFKLNISYELELPRLKLIS